VSAVVPVKFAERRVKMFLRFLAETGRVDYAARCAGFSDNSLLYRRRKADKEFAAAWEEALEIAGDRFEAEAARRAVEGVEEPVYHKGSVVGHVTKYSDSLLAKLMDGSKPEKYRHNVTEIKGKIGVAVGVAVIPMTAKSVEDWERECVQLHARPQPPMIDITPTKVEPEKEPPATVVRA
jgi:hypothetical protein